MSAPTLTPGECLPTLPFDPGGVPPFVVYLGLRASGLRLSWDRTSRTCQVGPAERFRRVLAVPEQAAALERHKPALHAIARWEFERKRPIEGDLSPGDADVVVWLDGFDPGRVALPYRPFAWSTVTDADSYVECLRRDLRLGPAGRAWGRAIREARRLAEGYS